MPLKVPEIDNRRYDDLVADALARIPVHTPEWTNFNRSDPGVTLIEVFAFLTESLLYRANLIPERNRLKFLQLLRIPLQTATPARGTITIANEAQEADPAPQVVPVDVEVRAGQVPFRTQRAVDVLPVEGRFFIKKKVTAASPELKAYYQQLYASFRGPNANIEPQLYESVSIPSRSGDAISLSDTIDNCIWLALIVREKEKVAPADQMEKRNQVRKRIARRTLSIGVVPALAATSAALPAGRSYGSAATVRFLVDAPDVGDTGGLPETGTREAKYKAVDAHSDDDLFSVGGILDIQLPEEERLRLWNNLDPLEAGVGLLPPAIEDPALDDRVVTWLRLTPSAPTDARFSWMGINAAPVTQLAHIANELLPAGTGEPDQSARLARTPVLRGSVRMFVTAGAQTTEWREVDDLLEAGAEVPLPDPRQSRKERERPTSVFTLNAEAGEIRFGDGTHGARPADRAVIRASYDYAVGAAGNVGPGAITSGTGLPRGFKVTNPLATTGGADAETVESGEKQVAAYLQHRDRLITANDFVTLTLRTPGVDVGRVEVLPNFLDGRAEVPGVVTLMVIPAYDPLQPEAPLPRKPFLDAICRYLDPRRLITTQVMLRPPQYHDVWISIGIKVAAGYNESLVCDAVKQDVLRFLAPIRGGVQTLPDDPSQLLGTPSASANGWKLNKPVLSLELAAVASRTQGVEYVNDDLIVVDAASAQQPGEHKRIDITGLQLPRVRGIRVTNGPAAGIAELMGAAGTGAGTGSDGSTSTTTSPFVQVPVIPEECR